MAHIVVAEDDPKQAELVRRYAIAEGHAVRVAVDGRAALDEIRRSVPDLLILDVMMPRLDGHDVCRIVRTTPELGDVPILMLTGRAGQDDLIDGFDLGADDYLTKPYSPRELMARVRALLRRRASDPATERTQILSVGPLTVSIAAHEVCLRGHVVECTPGEFGVLTTMAAEPGQVFSRDQLLRSVHGFDGYVTRRTIDVHVANLRKKLGPDLIRTVYGIGYSIPLLP